MSTTAENATPLCPTWSACRWIAWCLVIAVLVVPATFAAEGDAPPAAPFQPDDISIGEPIALPFAKPATPRTEAAAGPAPAAATATQAPVGWLGMAVAESNVAGRWAIVEVAADGPAAAAGIRVGDELRAVNGSPLRSADEVAQALTAIAAGQQVRLAVARADAVQDVVLAAIPRPAATTRDPQWQPASPPPAAGPVRAAAAPPPTASVLTPAPPQAAPPAAPPATARVVPQPLPPSVPASRGRTALGVRTVPIDAEMQARFRLPEPAGAYVVGVVGDLPASKAGIPPGSVIVALGDRPVRSPQDLSQLVASGPVDRPMPLQYVLPGGEGKRADVVLQSLERPLEQALVGDDALQASPVPTLVPGPAPNVSRRPEAPAAVDPTELRRELGRLRAWLDTVEQRLDRLSQRDDR